MRNSCRPTGQTKKKTTVEQHLERPQARSHRISILNMFQYVSIWPLSQKMHENLGGHLRDAHPNVIQASRRAFDAPLAAAHPAPRPVFPLAGCPFHVSCFFFFFFFGGGVPGTTPAQRMFHKWAAELYLVQSTWLTGCSYIVLQSHNVFWGLTSFSNVPHAFTIAKCFTFYIILVYIITWDAYLVLKVFLPRFKAQLRWFRQTGMRPNATLHLTN